MRRHFHPSAFQVLTMGFALLILLGAGLLSLPIAARGGPVPFMDALFTATSAACVTGLTLYDTYTRFTLFGQAVLLLLIQIGGLGLMTVASLISILLGRRIGLYQRSLLVESVGSLKLGGVVRLTRRALLGTAVIEGTGALLLALWFCPRFGMGQGLWMAVFHAVSAFCNAGFDLMGVRRPGSSMVTAAGEPLVCLTLMALIILGGLGFFLWDDVCTNRLRFRKYSLHTKLVLSATAIALTAGTVGFRLLEGNGVLSGAAEGEKWLMSAFQSVTLRTAGFSSIDQGALSPAGTLLSLTLMAIGAGSGSTGGGIKINTFAALLLGVVAYVRQSPGANVFRRRIDEDSTRRAFRSAGLYALVCLGGTMALCCQGAGLEDALFEAVSALSTVGLTRGLTPTLPAFSRVTVILLMFLGRLGSLSVMLLLTAGLRKRPTVRNVSEKILIG